MLADNYIVEQEGLPESLRELKYLRKLVLSHNLLQGSISANYFNNLRQLSHLEVEQTYISGPLPSSIFDMDELVSLYIRGNSFSLDFPNAIRAANWPNLYSMWLDQNNITGTIPAQIGKLTGLASLSLSSTMLRGPIPSEIGLLTGLRRVWLDGNRLRGTIPLQFGNLQLLEVAKLHGNRLQGTMPQGTCRAVAQAEYEYKVLSADCNRVNCRNCCTQCY